MSVKRDAQERPICLVWKKLCLYEIANKEQVKLTDAQKAEHAKLYQASKP